MKEKSYDPQTKLSSLLPTMVSRANAVSLTVLCDAVLVLCDAVTVLCLLRMFSAIKDDLECKSCTPPFQRPPFRTVYSKITSVTEPTNPPNPTKPM
jgi:hypothetical protein